MLYAGEWLNFDDPTFGKCVEILEVLLRHGLDINERCCSFGPSLHFVLEVVHCILNESGSNNLDAYLRGRLSIFLDQSRLFREFGADASVVFKGRTASQLAFRVYNELMSRHGHSLYSGEPPASRWKDLLKEMVVEVTGADSTPAAISDQQLNTSSGPNEDSLRKMRIASLLNAETG